MKKEVITTDLLVAGGGIAGLMAGIRASELGMKVIIAEKGATKYSGAARAGNDHFMCYLPEIHGDNLERFIRDRMLGQRSDILASLGPRVVRAWLERTHEIVRLWEDWGIPMKHDGQYVFEGHAFPGKTKNYLKYKGRNQKPILTEQALKRGCRIMDRVMVFDLLGDEKGIMGAFGLDTREDRLYVFQAKTVFLGTGTLVRIFPNVIPALWGNSNTPFTLSGDGRAMAYRLGAELFNMEMVARHAGLKNYIRSGQGTWIGVCRDPQDRPVGKYLDKPSRSYHDMIMEVDKQVFERYQQTGIGPVYMDCRGISDGDHEHLLKALEDEGNKSVLNHFKEETVDLRKNPVEFSTYEMRSIGRIVMNERAETSVEGLYTGGEESTFSISGAATFGLIGGESAARYAEDPRKPDSGLIERAVEKTEQLVESFTKRKNGPDWADANRALQHTMADYAGLVRSETMLEAGLRHLRRLKDKIYGSLSARDSWELTRCFEVVNLYDLAELVFIGALERKESRGLHRRADYAYTDPLLNGKLLMIKKVDGRPVTEWREIPHL
jgi:succinate dehydrogenase/fumarate reductase flavoprotein subunit